MVRSFQLVAGATALDLVNTLDNRFVEGHTPDELLADDEDLIQFLIQGGLLTERKARALKRVPAAEEERQAVVRKVRALREAIAAIVYAWVDGRKAPAAAVKAIEKIWDQVVGHRSLEDSQTGLTWRWPDVGSHLESPLWLLAEAGLTFLSSPDVVLTRRCANDTCRWLFVDGSKNHTRRWCDMKLCGNRMKARRHQQRQAPGSESD